MSDTSTFMSMPPKRVSETAPVQVYLDRQSRDRLDQLVHQLETSKSEVLRRGLLALERETSDPTAHPVLRLLGTAREDARGTAMDVARDHDRYLAGVHEAAPAPYPKARARRRD
jgi:hypothetical protein